MFIYSFLLGKSWFSYHKLALILATLQWVPRIQSLKETKNHFVIHLQIWLPLATKLLALLDYTLWQKPKIHKRWLRVWSTHKATVSTYLVLSLFKQQSSVSVPSAVFVFAIKVFILPWLWRSTHKMKGFTLCVCEALKKLFVNECKVRCWG